jgi:8-oxo-dGTP pyrophosphatase MutT (NUDIX family)
MMRPHHHGSTVRPTPGHEAFEGLRRRLRRHLDTFERLEPSDDGESRAAVAITLTLGEDGQAAFLLTKRPDTIKRYAGQWALPGGRLDHGETVTAAALRELDEELGLRLSEADVLGRLDDYPTRSGFRIAPVIVWGGATVDLTPDPTEVAYVVRVPLRELEREDSPRWLDIEGARGPVVQMPILEHGIHAPTAAILYQFREVALHGRATRVAHFDEPPFAWR